MIKSIYRNRVRTLLSLCLFISVLLLLDSQVLEYVGAAEDYGKSLDAYYGSGTVESRPALNTDPGGPHYIMADKRVRDRDISYQTLPDSLIREIDRMDYVDAVDARVMTAGVSDTYCRLDDGGSYYSHTARCVIEGTFAGLHKADPALGGLEGLNEVLLTDCTLLAGTSPWAVEGKPLSVYCLPFGDEQAKGWAVMGMQKRETDMYDESYRYDSAYMERLRVGARYAFVVRYEPLEEERYYLAGATTTWAYEAIWPAEPGIAAHSALMQIIDADLHTFDMVYTEDMASISGFAGGRMVIETGRPLTQADSDAAARVCVISHELAETYGLGVGDMLTFDLGNELFEQYKGLGAQAVLPQRFSITDTTVELEIVGVYADLDSDYIQAQRPNWYYSVNTVFLPKSIVYETGAVLDGHLYAPSEFSFRVNAQHIRAFTQETLPALEQMGYTVLFDDQGWPEMERGFQQAKVSMRLELCLYCVAVALVIALGIYLHIAREKKNYAIMRALGTGRKLAFRRLLTPFLLLFGVCVLLSALAALFGKPLTAIRMAALLGCVALEPAVALAAALVLLWRIERKPLLLLLQEGRHGK